MRNSGSHRPSGSLGDFTAAPVNRLKGHCEQCGCGVGGTLRRFCRPCISDRLDAQLREAKRRRRARAKAKLATTTAPP